jgi:hypothetical protein
MKIREEENPPSPTTPLYGDLNAGDVFRDSGGCVCIKLDCDYFNVTDLRDCYDDPVVVKVYDDAALVLEPNPTPKKSAAKKVA